MKYFFEIGVPIMFLGAFIGASQIETVTFYNNNQPVKSGEAFLVVMVLAFFYVVGMGIAYFIKHQMNSSRKGSNS